MRLLTPPEYRDAFHFWASQETPTRAHEIEEQLQPHLVRVNAEQVRRLAITRYRDTAEETAARLLTVNRDAASLGLARAAHRRDPAA